MHELIGKGFAEARRPQGLTQEQAARRLQGRGLTAWRKSTVGQLETGLRRPRLDEVLLLAAALNVSVDQLIPGGDDERVEIDEAVAEADAFEHLDRPLPAFAVKDEDLSRYIL